ncbi:MAG: choice-of-anchor D domain-containing protein [Ignavibacteriae bacterium]|nr:choice-of-anchor D domain-containing protein [Ignavibacteriota bacterium]
MKKSVLLFLFFFSTALTGFSQSLVGAYDFPYNNIYNYFWGITAKNDTLWVGTDYDNTASYPTTKLYKITRTAQFLDSLTTPFKFNHGLAWDGTGFWIAQDYATAGSKIYKINMSGVKIDSIMTGTFAAGIAGLALDGNNLWFAVYSPDYTTYPNAFAYKVSLATKTIVDTIPLRGRQVQGLAVKGDTIFYVNDNFHGEPERIYAFSQTTGDTLFSFPSPDPDGDCDPHGMYWDGQYLWLIAFRAGNTSYAYRTLYKYAINGQGTPIISTSSNTIDFGDVAIGTTANQTLAVTNNGSAKLIITGKNITNPRFGISPANVPDTINPGQSKNYTVSFSPLAYDSISGNLVLVNNDMVNPNKTILLKGKGVFTGANILLSDSVYNYNARRNNSLCGWNFKIINSGTSVLSINSITFNNPAYRLDTTGLTFPITVGVQGIRSLRIWFHPTGASSYPGTATINSNAVNAPVKTITLSGSTNTNPTTIGEIYWQGNVLDNPYTNSDDPQPISIKQIGDVNGDGVNDVIVSSGNYLTTCYNGNASITADSLWSFNTGYNNNNTGSVQWEDGMQIRSDIDGDGIQDVVIGCAGGNEMVYTISGRTGRKIWEWGDSVSYSDGDIEAVSIVKDYNGDGINDVLVSASGTGTGTGGRHALVCLNGLTGAQIFYVTQTCDFTGDVVATSFGGAIGLSTPYSINGFDNNGNQTWTYPTDSKLWTIKEFPSIGTDTIKELIGNWGFSGKLVCLAENNGTVNWTKQLGSSNNGRILLLDDIDSNGYIDFTMYGPQAAYRIDSKTSNIIWQNFLGASYLRGVDYLSDVNGDGVRDILISTQQPGTVRVLNGATGVQMWAYIWGSSLNQRGDRCAVLNSIDGNSTTEFIGGCRDSRLICFSGGINIPIGIRNISGVVPDKFSLEQNYPNPFNPTTNIRYQISKNSDVTLKIFDILGKEIATPIDNEKHTAGTYEISWDASKYPSGVYFYKMKAGDFSAVKRMVLVK